MITDPGKASRDHRRVNAHEARAWLVDYIAACERDADIAFRAGEVELGNQIHQVAGNLSGLLRRWDITNDGHHEPP